MTEVGSWITTAIFTYGAHSFIACVLAVVAGRFLCRPHDRDIVWKAALVAPIITAAVAVVISSFAGLGVFVDLADVVRRVFPADLPGRVMQVNVFSLDGSTSVVRRLTDPVTSTISAIALATAATLTFGALVRFAFRRRRFSMAIARRTTLGELTTADGATITLSTADLPSPLALGAGEICLPTEVVRDFSQTHQRSLIAHETAHLERRDPAWFFAAELIAALTAFQPLVFRVIQAFRRDVELICDETAVQRTHDRGSLIAALTLLASPFDPRSPLNGAPTARDGSPLVDRAERIACLVVGAPSTHVRKHTLLIAGLTVGALCAAPVISAAPRFSDFPRDPEEGAASARGMHQQIFSVERIVKTTGARQASDGTH